MCNLVVKGTYFVLLVCFEFVNTEVTIENGGYSVLVSFSQNVQSTEGKELLEKARESLEKASIILYDATGRQFTKVTFQIPESWNISELNIITDGSGVPRNTKADFLIDGTNDVIFGKFPFAQQYGSCGISGHQIIIPTAFFSDTNTFPKGTALAREWLKYRYGVFDENGYENDPLYPLSYVLSGDERKVTDCTNSPITYNFKDEGGALYYESNQLGKNFADSKVVPDAESLENVTSSVMYFHQDIPGMQHICGKNSDHQHNALSRNKHNAMCRSKSVWDVVKMSEDFKAETGSKEYSEIKFIYTHEKKLKVVVAWENTAKISKSKGKIILDAIKRFAYELPRGTKFNGFPFSDTLSNVKDYTLKELNDLSDKNGIMANIKSDFVKEPDGDLTIALSKALDILGSDSSNSEPEGNIIIIAKSQKVSSNILFERLQKAEVCVKILGLSEGDVSDETKNYTSALPCGSQEDIVVDDNDEFLFNQLFASMETILPATVDDKSTETVKTGYLSKDTSIALQVDEIVEKVTFWIFTDKESENFEAKFDQVDEALHDMDASDIMALSFYPKKAGDITFSYPHETDPIFTQVRVTSKAGKYLNGHGFIQDTTEISSSQQMPVIIFAVIRYGAYPVQNAKVTAIIERPNEKNTTLEMFDDGRGDPDITLNDGVYSRYFTQFTESGVYTVNVKVEITDLTSYGVDKNADYRTCCGSFLETKSSKIPASHKVFKTTFTAKSGRPDNGYKPSRITDLRIDKVIDDKIVLTWSAPGEEGDSGTVQSYEIKLYSSHEDAMNGVKGIILGYAITPLERGGIQTLELKLGDFTEAGRHYITITAKNAQQTGDASTILEIYIPGKEATTTPGNETDETSNDRDTKMGGTEKRRALIIGLVVGLIILIILIIVVVYFVVIKPKGKEKVKDNQASNATERDRPNVMNPINFISVDTLLKHHNEKTLAKMQNKEPPIFREEDFEETHSSQTPESRDNNNIQQSAGCNKMLDNEEHLPPKSPKKTTYV